MQYRVNRCDANILRLQKLFLDSKERYAFVFASQFIDLFVPLNIIRMRSIIAAFLRKYIDCILYAIFFVLYVPRIFKFFP